MFDKRPVLAAGTEGASPERQRLGPGDIAWLLVLPIAVVTVIAMLVLGGFLGKEFLSSRSSYTLLPEAQALVFHKPAEQARFALAIAAMLLVACLIPVLARRSFYLAPRVTQRIVVGIQFFGAAFIAVCIWVQETAAYGPIYGFSAKGFVQPYFTVRTLVVGIALAAGAVVVIRNARAWTVASSILTSSRKTVAAGAVLLAVVMTALWMLAAVNLDNTIGNAAEPTITTVSGMLDEVLAVVDGRSPLVNYIPTYASLWPYLIGLIMTTFGTTFGVFSLAMCTVSGLSLFAIFDVLRRVSRSAVAGLMLYLPFLATSLFSMRGGLVNRYGPSTLWRDPLSSVRCL